MFCAFCGRHIADGQRYCLHCGAEDSGIKERLYSSGNNGSSTKRDPRNQKLIPMKWYNFLVYFALFAGAMLNTVLGLLALSGSIHEIQSGIQPEIVYAMHESLKAVDIMYGLAMFATAILGVAARNKLAQFRVEGPTFLYALYGIGAIASLGYGLLVSAVSDLEVINLNLVITIIVQISMILVNKSYFEKRAQLFIN